jgi:tRNA A37 threonylcarbamoyltransferase TsaD
VGGGWRQAHPVEYVFLVGGFAESKLLEHRVKSELERPGRRVIVPHRPSLAVMKGAVMLGLAGPGRFANRVAKCTYGVNRALPWDPSSPDHRGREWIQRLVDGVMATSS